MIPETENVFSLSNGSRFFFAEYLVDAVSEVYQFDYKGQGGSIIPIYFLDTDIEEKLPSFIGTEMKNSSGKLTVVIAITET